MITLKVTFRMRTLNYQVHMSKSFKENFLAHKDEKFSCNFCGKSFTTRFSVKRHEEIHTLSPLERSYPCNFCGLRYMKKENVINHQKQNCPKKSQSQDLQLLAQISSPGLEKVGNDYICTYESCLFTNTQLSQMIQHFTNKHPEIKAVDLNNIKNASKPVTEKIYHANIQKSNDLKKMNSNNNKCAYCGKKVPKIEASGQNEACKKALKKSKDIEVINDWTVVKVEPLKSIKLEPLKTIKLEPLKSIKLEPLKSIKPEPLKNSESLANVKKEDIYEFSSDSLIEFQPVPSQELNKVRAILPNLKPKIVEFYSCPVSDQQEPCPKYDTEDKVRQHLMLSHKISIQQQMNIFKTIQKQVLTVF